jgi:hypothetical protein
MHDDDEASGAVPTDRQIAVAQQLSLHNTFVAVLFLLAALVCPS